MVNNEVTAVNASVTAQRHQSRLAVVTNGAQISTKINNPQAPSVHVNPKRTLTVTSWQIQIFWTLTREGRNVSAVNDDSTLIYNPSSAVRALIQAIAPDIANNSNGNLSSEEVASRLTDKLVELVGPEGAEKFDQHHNERGEVCSTSGVYPTITQTPF